MTPAEPAADRLFDEEYWRGAGLTGLGRGEAAWTEGERPPGRNRPTLYGDPVSWLVADAVGAALGTCPAAAAAADQVATVTISRYCTLHTMREIAAQAEAGRISPLRFAAASPGSVAGLPALAHGLRGPSLALAMPTEAGLAAALPVVAGWLTRRGLADFAAVSTHERGHTGRHHVRTVVLGPHRTGGLPPSRKEEA